MKRVFTNKQTLKLRHSWHWASVKLNQMNCPVQCTCRYLCTARASSKHTLLVEFLLPFSQSNSMIFTQSFQAPVQAGYRYPKCFDVRPRDWSSHVPRLSKAFHACVCNLYIQSFVLSGSSQVGVWEKKICTLSKLKAFYLIFSEYCYIKLQKLWSWFIELNHHLICHDRSPEITLWRQIKINISSMSGLLYFWPPL